MAILEIKKDPSRKELYWFGGLLFVFSLIVGGMVYWRFDAPRVGYGIAGIGSALSVLFFAVPRLRRPMYLGWMYLTFPIGFTVTIIVLGVTFFDIMTPMGWLMRAAGIDPMRRRLDSDAQSYWIQRNVRNEKSRYFRQS